MSKEGGGSNSYRKSLNDSMRPDFLNSSSNDSNSELPGKNDEKNATASASLSNMEKSVVSSDGAGYTGGTEDAREAEDSNLYNNSQQEGEANGPSGFGKKLPTIIVALMITVAMGGIVGTGAGMIFHVVEQFKEMSDVSFTSRNRRMPRIVKKFFNLENENDFVATKRKMFFGEQYKKYRRKVTKNTKRLASQGIELEGEGNLTKIKWKSNKTGEIVELSADDFGNFYRNNAEFRADFNRGTRGITGRIGAWFDLSAARFLNKFKLTRNLFKDWIESVFVAEGENTKLRDIIRGRHPDNVGGVDAGTRHKTNETKTDEDGKPILKPDGSGEFETEEVVHNTHRKSPNKKSPTLKQEYADMFNNISQAAGSLACAGAGIAATYMAIQTAITLDNARQTIMPYFEASDKTKSGDGANSPTAEVANVLLAEDENGKNALQAESMMNAISGGSVAPDLSEQNMQEANLEEGLKFLGTAIGTGITGIKTAITCSIFQGITSTVSMVLSFLSLGTFTVAKFAISVAAGVIAGGIINTIVERLISSVTSDKCVDVSGVVLGVCLALGARNALNENGHTGGMSPGSTAKLNDFGEAHVLALKEEAEYDRATKSPFDATNSNTFLGSIVSKLALPLSQTGNLIGVISSIGNITTNSIGNILPTASAIEKTQYINNQIGNCPNLEEIGAVGDMYCLPMFVTDMGTMDDDAEQIMNDIADPDGIYKGFEWDEENNIVKTDSNGIEVIKADSNLGKYIAFCTERESPFGVIDQNIVGAYTTLFDTGSSSLNNVINSVIGAVPIVDDVLNMLDAENTVQSLPWASGYNCVAREGENAVGQEMAAYTNQVISWDEMKVYQRYIEDDRLLQSVDPEAGSAVVAFMERLDEMLPKDESFEGVLARRTGYTKAQITVALNEMVYQDFVANYDPTEYGPMEFETKEYRLYVENTDSMPSGVYVAFGVNADDKRYLINYNYGITA